MPCLALQAQAQLERLDNLTRELSSIGNVRTMVHALRHLQRQQERAQLRGSQGDQGEQVNQAAVNEADEQLQQRREVRC
jgi:hypothetical protein